MRMSGVLLMAVLSLACDGPASLDDLSEMHLVEVMRFGSVDEAGSALSSVVGVAVTDSTVLVLENDPARVAVFDHEGIWLRNLSRAGDGPGELRYPSHLGAIEGGVWVGDPLGSRLELLDTDGRSVASYRWSIPPDSESDRAVPTAMFRDGSLLAGPRPVITARTVGHAYYRTTNGGEVSATLYRAPVSQSDVFSAALPGGGFVVGRHPLPESSLVAIYPDGSGIVAVERREAETCDRGEFRVRVIAPEGTIETDVAVPYAPIRADGWRERYLRESEQSMREETGSVDRSYLEALGEAWSERVCYPPVTEVVAGSDGSIWVRREQASDGPVAWQILTRSGHVSATVPLPPRLIVLRASLEEVWALELDDLDVPFVVRYLVGGLD